MVRARKRRRSEAEWSEVIKEFQSSGLTRVEFCRREGISKSSLGRWEAKLRPKTRDTFVELPAPVDVDADSAAAAYEISVELELPSGAVLRIRG
jgi:transposase-like protein